jgi:arsenate reductase
MLIYCYPTCSTCKKALQWLDGHGVQYTQRNIKEENPTLEELRAFYERSGLPLKKFFNTSGKLYKDNHIKDRLPGMSDDEIYDLLATDGMMVKRPVFLLDDGRVLVGFREEEWVQALGEN